MLATISSTSAAVIFMSPTVITTVSGETDDWLNIRTAKIEHRHMETPTGRMKLRQLERIKRFPLQFGKVFKQQTIYYSLSFRKLKSS